MNRDALLAEMRVFQDQVAGVTGTVLGTVDGMLIAANAGHAHPESLAAMAAAMMGLAQRATREIGGGYFRETVTRSDSGYVAVYAIGDEALLVVLADRSLNLGRLHLEARHATDRVGVILFGSRHTAD